MSRAHYSLISRTSGEPVSYDQAAEFLRLGSDDEIELIESLISVAREYVESVTGRATMRATYKLTAPSWDALKLSGSYLIDRTPLVSIESVSYIAEDETDRTVMDPADYIAITATQPGQVYFPDDSPLPILAVRPDAVEIEFTAGYAEAVAVPAMLRHCIKVLVAHFYELRLPVGSLTNHIPMHLQSMLINQRTGGFIL